jgi:hypothetical protein
MFPVLARRQRFSCEDAYLRAGNCATVELGGLVRRTARKRHLERLPLPGDST